MKSTLFIIFCCLTILAVAQKKDYIEFKAGPNFTSVLDGQSTADYGYDFSIGFTKPSKNGKFDWNIALLQSKSSALVRYNNGYGSIANSSIPGSDDVSYFDIKKSAYFISIPFSIRFHITEGRHSFYFENSAGPGLLAMSGKKETYHYETNPDYILEYNRMERIMSFRMMVAAAFGWEMKLNDKVNFSLSPTISCMFLDLSPISFGNNYYNKPTVMLGIRGGLAFGY